MKCISGVRPDQRGAGLSWCSMMGAPRAPNPPTAALRAAGPGQTIHVHDGLYVGVFVAAASGTASAPITLAGSRAAILSSGSLRRGYGLHVTGSRWRISGFAVSGAAKGIVLDGSAHTVISNVDVGGIGSEGVHFRCNSSDSILRDSDIHHTGLESPGHGEGVYIGSSRSNWESVMGAPDRPDRSDRVQVLNNRIFRTSASLYPRLSNSCVMYG